MGEVYLMAGQSNMQFALARSRVRPTDYVDEPRLRGFAVSRVERGRVLVCEDVQDGRAVFVLACRVVSGRKRHGARRRALLRAAVPGSRRTVALGCGVLGRAVRGRRVLPRGGCLVGR